MPPLDGAPPPGKQAADGPGQGEGRDVVHSFSGVVYC